MASSLPNNAFSMQAIPYRHPTDQRPRRETREFGLEHSDPAALPARLSSAARVSIRQVSRGKAERAAWLCEGHLRMQRAEHGERWRGHSSPRPAAAGRIFPRRCGDDRYRIEPAHQVLQGAGKPWEIGSRRWQQMCRGNGAGGSGRPSGHRIRDMEPRIRQPRRIVPDRPLTGARAPVMRTVLTPRLRRRVRGSAPE